MAAARGHWSKVRGEWRWVGRLPWRTREHSKELLDTDALKLWMREMDRWGNQMAAKLKETSDRLAVAEQHLARHARRATH